MATRTRERMIDAAVGLLQRHGLSGMSFSDVITASGAARGAIYHHFPGGKDQLASEAATRHGHDVRGYLSTLPATSPHDVVRAFLGSIRPVLQASAEGSGCAVAAITVDSPVRSDRGGTATTEDLRAVAATAFDSWTGELAAKLTAAGMPRPQARNLGALLVTLLQGAHVTCRAAGSLEPFDNTAESLLALVRQSDGGAVSIPNAGPHLRNP